MQTFPLLLLNQRGENMIINQRRDEERVFTTVPSMSTQLSCRIRARRAVPEFVGSLTKVTFADDSRAGRPGQEVGRSVDDIVGRSRALSC